MSKNSNKTRSFDGLQGACALIGITFGGIPLIRWTITGEHGALFRWIFGNTSGSMAYVAPLVVIAAAVGVIAALEGLKRRA